MDCSSSKNDAIEPACNTNSIPHQTSSSYNRRNDRPDSVNEVEEKKNGQDYAQIETTVANLII